ncbi:MAG: tetratricopeptide repeat protein [Mucilaginibacter sp.]|uniref:tetratricopeptide repeat protein n=1 Tax=Mucilaginibacter sp. TaxID=1882438 RepID=UPI00326421C0
MKIKCFYLLLVISIFALPIYGIGIQDKNNPDSTQITLQNKRAYDNRLTDPELTVKQAKSILVLAQKINFTNGEAEANRVIGIGYSYLSQPDTSLSYYLKALALFQGNNNQNGLARVNNNIGNLYKESDYEKSIEYYTEALNIAKKVRDEDLIATIYLNFGNIYYRKKNFNQALVFYNQSSDLFTKLNNTTNMIQCLQNKGVVYFKKGDLDTAQSLLLQANIRAKDKDLNTAVASINLTLTSLFVQKGLFAEAVKYLQEGLTYARLVKSTKLEYDYKITTYELELKRKDYKAALFSLMDINKSDSINNKSNESIKLNLLNVQYKQTENQHKTELLVAQQNRQQILFWATILVAGLLLVVIFLLISNVNRKAKTNKHLTELNEKVTEQKENLNQINHHLEEIIDERTKDLQVKNKKLADYSLHLSHQIRGPIATLKGLLNLEKDKLIEQDECIKLMNKCVSEIDDNIIDMSGMLHESAKKV